AGFWGQLTGAVVSRAEDGASLEIRVQTVSPDDKRNKLQNPAALVGTTLRVIRPTNPGQASYTRRIRELAVGDRLWLKAYAGPEGRALNAQAFYRFESDADRDQILLVGDSILDWWMPPRRIGGVGVINRSVAGDGSWGILANLDSRILDARPKLLVLHIGANDLLSTRAEATAGRIGQILDRVIAAMPDLPIVLCTVMPQDPARVAPTKIRELNTLLDALARKHRTVSVVDLFTPFANPDGAFDASLFVDRVHPNPAGYERLAELLTAAIETRLTNDAKAQLIETFDRAPDGKPLRWELYVDEGGIDAHGRITLRDGHAVIDYGSHYLFVTDQVALEQPLRRIEWSASMEQDETVHPVIQIDFNNNGRDRDDPVYVSVRGFSGSGSHVLESADAEWVRLDFMPQSQARNNAGQLAGQLSKRVVPIHEGAIVAVGFYAPRRTTAHRFGPIQVYAQALVQADPAAAKPPETIEVQRPIDHRTEVDVTAVTGGVVDERAVQHTIDLNPDSDLPAVFAEVGKSLADGTPTRVRVADGLYRQNFPAVDGE
ncbi:MAG TPA: GDSL-type esterase/lipase family protein, partial [Tepidisphaeraceae bacterium]|nr:GDSL-type esterase/lipase family protein [Tepidisphaeraceae bacterium]